MISHDSQESFRLWVEKPDIVADYGCFGFNVVSQSDQWMSGMHEDPLTSLFNHSSILPKSFNIHDLEENSDLNDLELKNNSSYFSKPDVSPPKVPDELGYWDEYCYNVGDANVNKPFPDKCNDRTIVVKDTCAPLSPDSGIEQDGFNSSFDEMGNCFFSTMEKDQEVNNGFEIVKVNNESDLDKYIENNLPTCETLTDEDLVLLDELLNSTCDNIESLQQKSSLDYINGYESSSNDSITRDQWFNEGALNPVKNQDVYSTLSAGLVLQPVKKECETKEELDEADLYRLKNNSQTFQNEHCYHKKLSVVESDEDDIPVKKRKRDEVDEDFSPYQKPKRKAGRPRTNFSKVNSQKTQRIKIQNTKVSKRTTQASKKLKNCSSVPFDRREQHNQAERERRDMLKRNLDIVEDITPDHILHLTQIALQAEKTCKSDEFENNENNFTVDVLKKLDELMKKEPVNHRQKYKKASRNSKMVVLLGSTYYLSSIEKELKVRESRLAQVKKQYEECLKRLNPTKVSKKMRRNY